MNSRASRPAPTLRGRWLLLARIAWLDVAISALGQFVISVPARYAQLANPTAEVRAALAEIGLAAGGYALYNVVLDTDFVSVSPWSPASSSGVAQRIPWRCSSPRCWWCGDR